VTDQQFDELEAIVEALIRKPHDPAVLDRFNTLVRAISPADRRGMKTALQNLLTLARKRLQQS